MENENKEISESNIEPKIGSCDIDKDINKENTDKEKEKKLNPLFPFMGIGSFIYAFFYTLFLYKNDSGITYPFFVGGTCFFFFFYLKKSGITAKKTSLFPAISIFLLGISTCLTDSGALIFLNKVAIFFLFFYLCLHSLYEDKDWNLSKYIGSITNIVCSSLLHILDPFFDLSDYSKAEKIKKNKKEGKGKYIFFGILISLPLLFIVLLLLYDADAVFSNLLDHIFDLDISIDLAENIWGIIFLFLFAFFASYSIMSRLMVHNIKEEIPYKRTAEPVMGITFTGILSLVYLVFCYIQVVYLFGQLGNLPKDYTYSSYAREGFFQLVFVCLINLALILICIKRFRDNKILKGILTFISICTYIMIASSFYRMMLYISAYYMTFLRFFVLWALIVISLLMGGAVYMIYREKFPFTRYFLTTVTVLFLLLSFSHPDYWIARYNLGHSLSQGLKGNDSDGYDRYMEGFYDYHYLVGLSNDAAPVIFGKAKELGYEDSDWFLYYVEGIVRENNESWFLGEDKLPQKLPLRKWNYSRWRAIDLCIENKQGHA